MSLLAQSSLSDTKLLAATLALAHTRLQECGAVATEVVSDVMTPSRLTATQIRMQALRYAFEGKMTHAFVAQCVGVALTRCLSDGQPQLEEAVVFVVATNAESGVAEFIAVPRDRAESLTERVLRAGYTDVLAVLGETPDGPWPLGPRRLSGVDLLEARRCEADEAYERFVFPGRVEATDGWEYASGDGPVEFRRAVYLKDPVDDQPSYRVVFSVIFLADSAQVYQTRCDEP
ncbi:MAG: hypothetical protein C0497_04180 [Gemmatimonas sp.]|nr:hypothetical protein [Gemmatimonas sp.]